MLTRAQLKNVMGGFDEGVDPPSGKCGVNIYGHGGEKIDEMRGMTKTAAISYINTWNTSHQGWCTTNCNAVAKWCCASC